MGACVQALALLPTLPAASKVISGAWDGTLRVWPSGEGAMEAADEAEEEDGSRKRRGAKRATKVVRDCEVLHKHTQVGFGARRRAGFGLRCGRGGGREGDGIHDPSFVESVPKSIVIESLFA